jgi:hypothetical protein
MTTNTKFTPLRNLPTHAQFNEGDVLVLFGELFNRGYATGLVEEAEKKGMKILLSTVGRRNKDNTLRPLTPEEIAQFKHPVINVPLEAGFDLEPSLNGISPVDQCKDATSKNWESLKLNWQDIEESRSHAISRFKLNTSQFVTELRTHLPQGKNVLFAHLMAGGVPRAKIILLLMNRVFKGQGDRHISSKKFWESDLGKLTAMSFLEVSSETFRYLVEATKDIRNEIISKKGEVSYLAYGYHGTEAFINDGQLQWQTYTPYLQGYAKVALENISNKFFEQKIHTTVYNCPEIITNSSSIFPGVEMSLYTILNKLKELKNPSAYVRSIINESSNLIKDQTELDNLKSILNDFFRSPLIKENNTFDSSWPNHSKQEQMDFMLATSDRLIDAHKSDKILMTQTLSELIIKACGKIMLHESRTPKSPVLWLGHDILLKLLESNQL